MNGLLAVLGSAVAAAGFPVTAGAKIVSSYCSPSGDLCYGVFDRGGRVQLRITTAARYFQRYILCVVLLPRSSAGAEHAPRCGSFPVFRQAGGTWGSTVKYSRQYPVTLPGRYRVTWKLGSRPLGPSLNFRLPLAR